MQRYPEYQYTALVRNRSKGKALEAKGIDVIHCLSELDNVDPFDAIINLAGEPIADKRWSKPQKKTICDSRWDTTASLVSLIAKSTEKPAVFISGSAIGYYGISQENTFDESSRPEQEDFCHVVCKQWEQIASQCDPATRTVLLRTGVVLGTQGGALKKMWWPFKLGLGGKLGSGRQPFSWIHIDDMVTAINFILTNESMSGPCNLTAPTPVSNKTFTQAVARAMRRPAIFPVPRPILKLLMGEAATLLLDGQRVVPQKLLNHGFKFQYADITSTMNQLTKTA